MFDHGKKTKAQQNGYTIRFVTQTYAHTHEKITTLSPGMWRLAISLL